LSVVGFFVHGLADFFSELRSGQQFNTIALQLCSLLQ
jgi:hypothetical protein